MKGKMTPEQKDRWIQSMKAMAMDGKDEQVILAARMQMSLTGKSGEEVVEELVAVMESCPELGEIADSLARAAYAFGISRQARDHRDAVEGIQPRVAGAIGDIRAALAALTETGVDYRLTFAPKVDENAPEPWWALFELMGHVRFVGLVRTAPGRYPMIATQVQAQGPPRTKHVGRSAIFQITEVDPEEAARHLLPYTRPEATDRAVASVMRAVADDKTHWTCLSDLVSDDDDVPFASSDGGGE